mmetsp:Transcript_11746/g.30179  ORF Transcript_11746/g.30179 Transcript_11746/m.30179 type:complete len:528 (-) Transcript_11746:914-2497(-)
MTVQTRDSGISDDDARQALLPTLPPVASVGAKGATPSKPDRRAMSHREKAVLSCTYVFSMICLGACYGIQGPATLHIAEQVGIVQRVNGTLPKDASNLPELGLANALDAGAGVIGGLFGGFLVDRLDAWHIVLAVYLLWQGATFVAFTEVTDYEQFLAASVGWGWSSTLPSLSTQAAMTWIWAEKAGPWLQINNAGFGIGALTAPLLVSWDLSQHGTYHNAYWIIAGLNFVIAFTPLLLPSPRRGTGGSGNGEGVAAKVGGLENGDTTMSPIETTALLASSPSLEVGHLQAEKSLPTPSEQQGATNRAIASSRDGVLLWATFYLWFVFYVATELGIANWASPYAALEGLMGEDDAAVLSTVYYGAFTVTRLLAACFPSTGDSAIMLIWVCDTGTLGGMVMLVFAQRLQSTLMLWLSMGTLGVFTGPLWAAQLTILPERYGVELSAKMMAVALCMSKLGMAGEQVTFSWVLANYDRGENLPYVLMGIFGGAVFMQLLLIHAVLPRLERKTDFAEIRAAGPARRDRPIN